MAVHGAVTLPLEMVVVTSLQGVPVTVSTWQKAIPSVSAVASPAMRTSTASQTVLPSEHVRVSGCRMCLNFLPVTDGSSEFMFGKCAQVELLSLVKEF